MEALHFWGYVHFSMLPSTLRRESIPFVEKELHIIPKPPYVSLESWYLELKHFKATNLFYSVITKQFELTFVVLDYCWSVLFNWDVLWPFLFAPFDFSQKWMISSRIAVYSILRLKGIDIWSIWIDWAVVKIFL